MITIKRHPNLNNWINISFFGKVIEQTTSRAEALRIAEKTSRKHKTKIYDIDLRNGQSTKHS